VARPETSSRAVGGRRVERHAHEGRVHVEVRILYNFV
jgi:hypothetical protein